MGLRIRYDYTCDACRQLFRSEEFNYGAQVQPPPANTLFNAVGITLICDSCKASVMGVLKDIAIANHPQADSEG
jgi:rubredoxin